MTIFTLVSKYWLLVSALTYIFILESNFAKANDSPRLAAANKYLAQAKIEGETDEYYSQGGTIGTNPGLIFKEAEKCFNDESIYSSCDEAYRLTETGELNVPPEYTEQYCSGPCLTETQHVLECIAGVSKHFIFYNRATLEDVGKAIEHGCSYGPKRGNFDVAEHIRSDGAGKNKVFDSVLLVLMMVGWRLLF